MKILSLTFILILIASSCGNAKKPSETNTTEIIAITTASPKAEELSKPTETVVEEVIKIEEITSIETETSVIEEEETSVVEEVKKELITETPTKPQAKFDHSSWNELLQKYVSNQGHVNYKGMKSERSKLTAYITSLSENTPTNSWSKEEKLAFWINAYNALTVDLILRNYPVKSIKDINDPWKQRLWKLGDKWYDLEEIEHQILRKMNEPRIHFGIVCASYSCPKLQNTAFTALDLDNQLTNAVKEFLSDSKRNEISANSIKLSKIFSWFAKDFKQNGSLIDFLNKYSEVKISKNAKKSYKDYNWSLNE